jgi:hypothetical protein
VVNALSDQEHPCQALADFFTLWERDRDLRRLRLAWIGDGNNVCNSILLLGSMLGTTSVVACPPGYEPDPAVLEACRALGGRVQVTTEARDAVEDADVVYTDTWISMGQEGDREQRLEAFQRYQVNDRLLGFAPGDALVMHCLPAHRGEEITDAVLDGPRSLILDQAENRLHAQNHHLHLLDGLTGGSQRHRHDEEAEESGARTPGDSTPRSSGWLRDLPPRWWPARSGQGEPPHPEAPDRAVSPHRRCAGVRPRLCLPHASRGGLQGPI